MRTLETYLKGGDLRSIAKVNDLIPMIQTQKDFDKLFQFLHSTDRLIVMRAADAIEKITIHLQSFLEPHKKEVLSFLKKVKEKEFKWHLALMVTRLKLNEKELHQVWEKLKEWSEDSNESKIVRVNSIQSMHQLSLTNSILRNDFEEILEKVKQENIPSINARLKKILRNS